MKTSTLALMAVILGICLALAAENIMDSETQQKFVSYNAPYQAAQSAMFYQIDEASDSLTYLCYSSVTEPKFIRKIVKSGNVTTNLKTIATWDNRTTATYVPIDK